MGSRGPQRTPTAILAARGSRLVVDRVGEPQASGHVGDPPADLCPVAADCWQRIVDCLGRLGILDEIDRNPLERYCRLFARWRLAEADISEGGPTQTREDGTESDRPCVARAARLAELLAKLEQSMGMSPAARASLAQKPKGDDGESAGYFGQSA